MHINKTITCSCYFNQGCPGQECSRQGRRHDSWAGWEDGS